MAAKESDDHNAILASSTAAPHKKDNLFRLFLLFLMTAQNSSMVLLSRFSRVGIAEEDLYVINDVVMLTEVVKLVFSLALEQHHTNGELLVSIQKNIINHPIDFFRILFPSLLYLVQNSLCYVAITNLTAPMFQVTYQCKLVITAIVSVIMLKRKYTIKQWICLTTLGLGVAVVVLGAREGKAEEKDRVNAANTQNIVAGLVAVTVACLCSAIASVYFEKVLKHTTDDGEHSRPPVSMWMRNIQMAFFSTVIAFVNAIRESKEIRGYTGLTNEDNVPIIKPFMHGFTIYVYGVVFLQAGGGMLVAAVIKYADNVLKGMATGVSVITATLFSTFLFGTHLSGQFVFGAGIILMSVYLFSNDFPCGRVATEVSDADVEMQHLVQNGDE